MHLAEIRASSFRAFSDICWKFPSTGLVMVAGANNSGKSSLLATLDAIVGIDEGSASTRRHAASSIPPIISAIFILDDSERAALLASLGASRLAGGQFGKRVGISFEEDGDSFSVKLLRVSDHDGQMIDLAYPEVDESSNTYIVKLLNSQLLLEISASYHDRLRQSRSMTFETAVSYVEEISIIVRLLAEWRSRYFHFRALRSGAPRSTGLSSEKVLTPSGSNLPAVLLHLTTNQSDVMDNLRKLISGIVPDVGRLETPTYGNSLEVAFSDPRVEGFRHNLKELGTGVEQLLMTIVVGLTQSTPCTLVIEEPETNLHPAAQRAILSLLREWSRDRLIVIATHSPVMLDRAGANGILYHVTRSLGESSVRAVEAEPLELFSELGVRFSDVMSAERILVVEGESDEEVLSAWFPEQLRNPRLAVISGGGGDSARHAQTLAKWLDSADGAGRRRVIFMRDRDELSAEAIASLDAMPAVHVLKKRELENYLLDSLAISKVLALLNSGSDKTVPEVGELDKFIVDAANELRLTIIVNRTVRNIKSPRLMDNRTRQALAAEGASVEEIKRKVISLIPEHGDIGNQIDGWWAESVEQVRGMDSNSILDYAPGEEVLDKIFMNFTGRHFKKKIHGPMIASRMEMPPLEILGVLSGLSMDSP